MTTAQRTRRAEPNVSVLVDVVNAAAIDLVTMQRTLFDAGLLETARAVNEASVKLGWEAARKIAKALED